MIGSVRTNHKKVMVGPMIQFSGEEEEWEGKTPPWLWQLLRNSYFTPCSIHFDSSKNECNHYCLDCMGVALCSSCLADHSDHCVIQIRKSSYHNVVRVSEVSKFIDISCVQTYVINSAKIVFLNERPQPRPGKGVTNTCEICHRSLIDSYRFCSLGCKLNGMKQDPELTFSLRHKLSRDYSHWSEFVDSYAPRKLLKTSHRHPHHSHRNNNEDSSSSISPETPPIVNYRRIRHRRKGIPHRAPF